MVTPSSSVSSNTAAMPEQLSWDEAVAKLQGPDLAQRYYAAWYLGMIRDPRSVDILLQALKDEDDRTALGGYPLRRNAAKSLGLIGDTQAVPGLVAALECSDFYVRAEAAYALAKIGDREALPSLIQKLEAPDTDQPWEAIIDAIGQLQGQTALTLIHPFLTHHSERVQSAAAWVLYRFTQDEQFTQILVQLIQSEDAMLRQAATFDLAESGWLGGVDCLGRANVAINLRIKALKRLFDVAVELEPTQIRQAAEAVIPWMDVLL